MYYGLYLVSSDVENMASNSTTSMEDMESLAANTTQPWEVCENLIIEMLELQAKNDGNLSELLAIQEDTQVRLEEVEIRIDCCEKTAEALVELEKNIGTDYAETQEIIDLKNLVSKLETKAVDHEKKVVELTRMIELQDVKIKALLESQQKNSTEDDLDGWFYDSVCTYWIYLEANHSQNHEVSIFFPTDSHP